MIHVSSSLPVTAVHRPRVAAAAFTRRDLLLLVALALGHVALAIAMRAYPIIATAHAAITFGVALIFASTTRQIRRLSLFVGYIVGCEVLWRMNRAAIPWEFGKYAIAAVLGIALVRMNVRKNRALALAYFALLVPSAALTFMTLDLDSARQEVSFYLACPLALSIAVMFYSNARLTLDQLRGTFVALVIPVIGIAALSFFSTISREDLVFANASNLATSGGFGPNQVSAVLGLGVLFLILLSFDNSVAWTVRAPLLLVAAGLATQSALTFARGGLVLAFAGSLAAFFFVLRGRRRGRVTVVVVAILSIGIGKYVIEPRLDDFTEGKLSARYESTKASGRNDYILSEFMMFGDNPVLGVGPGVGAHLREELDLFSGASHTEYTRMLAEHGVLGILSLICLVVLAVRSIRAPRDSATKGLAAALVVWTALFLLINGTRIAAPAFVFGLAFGLPGLVRRPTLSKAIAV